jgi:hypothetical protein
VLKEAIDLRAKDKRPTLIEAETYRYRGHSMSDPGKYRTKEEVEQMMLQDPIVQFGKRLIEQERFAQSDLDAVDAEIMHIVDECVTFSDESPFPSPEALYQDVYVRSPYINMKAAEKDPGMEGVDQGGLEARGAAAHRTGGARGASGVPVERAGRRRRPAWRRAGEGRGDAAAGRRAGEGGGLGRWHCSRCARRSTRR